MVSSPSPKHILSVSFDFNPRRIRILILGPVFCFSVIVDQRSCVCTGPVIGLLSLGWDLYQCTVFLGSYVGLDLLSLRHPRTRQIDFASSSD